MSTASEKAALAADRATIVECDAQILELESALESLKEKKKLVQNRLDAYAYPVMTLPNEMVAEIFVRFLPVYPECPPPIGLLSPYLLCQICRKWREVALSTPALWRAFSLSLRKPSRFEQNLRLLEVSLQRSGSCPLSIQFVDSIGVYKTIMTEIFKKISAHYNRWEHMDLSTPWPLKFIASIELRLPLLRTLKLGYEMDNLDLGSTPTFLAPFLRKVVLEIYRPGHGPILPWSQLTVLSVNCMELNLYGELLDQLINIVYCRFYFDFDHFDVPQLR